MAPKVSQTVTRDRNFRKIEKQRANSELPGNPCAEVPILPVERSILESISDNEFNLILYHIGIPPGQMTRRSNMVLQSEDMPYENYSHQESSGIGSQGDEPTQ